MPKLSLSNVSYRYKGAAKPAVHDLLCEFEPGALYAIIGPSGSGKSTLLSLLMGLDMPTEGAVLYDGQSLAQIDQDRYRREDVSMVFQSFQLFPLMTVMENVCYPMEMQGIAPRAARGRAATLLEQVGIVPAQMKRYPAHLSGGEQQRIAIARSLATGAKTILADEPTGNLDAANKLLIVEILAQLAHDEGYCVVVVTHDLNVAEVADVVYRMADGQLHQE